MLRKLWTIRKKPVVISAGVFSAIILGHGVNDFNHPVGDCPGFKPSGEDIGNSMNNLHDLAIHNLLTFAVLREKKNHCIESFSLYCEAEAEVRYVMADLEMTEEEAQETVARVFKYVAVDASRRALIRNGDMVRWMRAVIYDEIIRVLILPSFNFFARILSGDR
jgi:hypothetical protein